MPAAHASPSLLLCSDPATSSHAALIGPHCRSIHIDLVTASHAPNTPKMTETPPMVAGIEIPAGEVVSGDAADAESAPIGDGLSGPYSGGPNGRVQRLSADCGGPDAWRGRAAGLSARAGEPEGGMAAVPARGRVWNASAACCSEAIRVSSG